MKYINIITAVHRVLSELEIEIEGEDEKITFIENQNLFIGEPDMLQRFPLLYSVFDNVKPEEIATSLMAKPYITLHRICFQPQDKRIAEVRLAHLVDVIPETLERIDDLIVLDVDSGWTTVANIQCRALDVITQVTITC